MFQRLNLDKISPTDYRQLLMEAVKNHEVSPEELKMLHVRQEKVSYSGVDGHKTSEPRLQKYNVKEWGDTPESGVQGYLLGLDYKLDILFDPREAKAEKKQPAAKKTAKAETTESVVLE